MKRGHRYRYRHTYRHREHREHRELAWNECRLRWRERLVIRGAAEVAFVVVKREAVRQLTRRRG